MKLERSFHARAVATSTRATFRLDRLGDTGRAKARVRRRQSRSAALRDVYTKFNRATTRGKVTRWRRQQLGGGADSSVADELRKLGVERRPRADGRARPAPRREVRDAAVLLPPGSRASSIRSRRRVPSGRRRPTTTRSSRRPEATSAPRTSGSPTSVSATNGTTCGGCRSTTMLRKRQVPAEDRRVPERGGCPPRPTARTDGQLRWSARPSCPSRLVERVLLRATSRRDGDESC